MSRHRKPSHRALVLGLLTPVAVAALTVLVLRPGAPTAAAGTEPQTHAQALTMACVAYTGEQRWDRCSWRTAPGRWTVVEYPTDGPPVVLCRTDAGEPCPARTAWRSG